MIKKICKHCPKEIEGHTEKQVEYMIKQHTLSKHPEKVEIK